MMYSGDECISFDNDSALDTGLTHEEREELIRELVATGDFVLSYLRKLTDMRLKELADDYDIG